MNLFASFGRKAQSSGNSASGRSSTSRKVQQRRDRHVSAFLLDHVSRMEVSE